MRQRHRAYKSKVWVIRQELRARGDEGFTKAYLRHTVMPHSPEDRGMGREHVTVHGEGPPSHNERHIRKVAGPIHLLHTLHKRCLACTCNSRIRALANSNGLKGIPS